MLVCLMKQAKLILTDSGGIQEEAPAFGVPLLVMRLTTERKEGVNSGFAQLVGHTKDVIISKASEVLAHEKVHTRIKNVNNPYGDGKSAIRIKNFIEHYV
jgi:UDP-N-acetylglucosamine 2-epimerase (non-hydrolysing)